LNEHDNLGSEPMPAKPKGNNLRPFRWTVDEQAIADLHHRLDHTRWPEPFEDPQWSWGAERDTMEALVSYWRHAFDLPEAVARVNAFDQYLIEIDGFDLHFVHQPSPHANATPLILTHGWPGSVVEFLDLIPRLTEPERFGGQVEDAFHVVCPSIAGFGWSQTGSEPGIGPRQVARRHAALMAALGYERYLAHGGDFGAPITQLLADLDADHCEALHVSVLLVPPPAVDDPMALVADHEWAWLEDTKRHEREGTGYFHLQTTCPRTPAYALMDSPVGLCAWIAEKFHAWADTERDGHRDIRNAVSWDTLLTNVSLYWFSGCIGSSMRMYKELMVGFTSGDLPPVLPATRPLGVSVYPGELFKMPQAWVRHRHPVVYWHEASRGGHFAATELPQDFAEDLRAFRRAVVARRGE
jgi:microsomal epoxide hydrolase